MPASPEFLQVLARLHDLDHPFPPIDLYQFSDLGGANLAALEAAWPALALVRRRAVVDDLAELAENNFEVNFETVFRLGLEDVDAEVRAQSIRSLWEAQDPALIAPLLDYMLHDPEVDVRAAAAGGLGRFVYLGEVDDLPAPQARRVADALLAAVRGTDDVEVRRRALEAVAYSSRPEVADLIERAYAAADDKLRVSAVFAMGRSADTRWAAPVMRELANEMQEMRFEAVRAAGELELGDALQDLTELVDDHDAAVRSAAIWSLSQVGGAEAARVLQRLLETAGEDEVDYIEEALENLTFANDVHSFSLLAFGEEGEDDDDDDEALDEDGPDDAPAMN
jgi:HEAT repeat protein